MFWLAAAIVLWIVVALLAGPLLRNPRDDVEGGLVYHTLRLYVWLLHRPAVAGREHVPRTNAPGSMIVVANHASGVDPLLVQYVLPFEPRWMMAAHMRHPLGEGLWRWARIIFVSQRERDAAGVRDALRHLADGGVLGLFPEGGIERRKRTLRPFQPGIGMLIRRSNAPVLPIVIEDAPMASTAWASLAKPSRPRIRILPPVQYDRTTPPAEIAADLQARFEKWTGWAVEGKPDDAPEDDARAENGASAGVAV
ncbi:MAG: lysophospholipid acyltransferase family protein [Planctomycetota bacterium]